MTWRDEINAICAALPGAEKSDPWNGGHDCWKIGGKMFALHEMEPDICVKCPDIETAELLRDTINAERAPYFHRSWVRLPKGTDLKEARHRIHLSYGLIRSGLTKKLQACLPEWEGR
ncbi:MmcQ/YjbR family DNA-binding protein [Roseinatronobacter monicus]|uniref:MmcQ/YjbR family DNA-binding protein n=1 Tax=Roseinatronobacter monicus TaxID=393481 RepID=UPI003F2DC218